MNDPLVDLLEAVCPALDAVGAVYAVTGSLASSIHGQPLMSYDVDVGVRMTEAQARELAQRLPPNLYRDVDAMVDAVRRNSMANIIDIGTHAKLDLSVFEDSPFYQSALARRQTVAYRTGGREFWTVSPEDIILMKLIWRKDTGSNKQWDNAKAVIEVQRGRLDFGYLRRWADQLEVRADLNALLDETGF